MLTLYFNQNRVLRKALTGRFARLTGMWLLPELASAEYPPTMLDLGKKN
jgi:hypothetical protein